MDTSQIHFHCATMGTPCQIVLMTYFNDNFHALLLFVFLTRAVHTHEKNSEMNMKTLYSSLSFLLHVQTISLIIVILVQIAKRMNTYLKNFHTCSIILYLHI